MTETYVWRVDCIEKKTDHIWHRRWNKTMEWRNWTLWLLRVSWGFLATEGPFPNPQPMELEIYSNPSSPDSRSFNPESYFGNFYEYDMATPPDIINDRQQLAPSPQFNKRWSPTHSELRVVLRPIELIFGPFPPVLSRKVWK